MLDIDSDGGFELLRPALGKGYQLIAAQVDRLQIRQCGENAVGQRMEFVALDDELVKQGTASQTRWQLHQLVVADTQALQSV